MTSLPGGRGQRAALGAVCLAALSLPSKALGQNPPGTAARDLVGIAIVGEGRAILLATPGLEHDRRLWRIRSLDTSELPQPVVDVSLSWSGTKLFVQTPGMSGVLDLTNQHKHNVSLQPIAPRDLATGGMARGPVHRLPGQRFVSIRDGTAQLVDDLGAALPSQTPLAATHGAMAPDGVALYVRQDRATLLCGEAATDSDDCRELAARVEPGPLTIVARSNAADRRRGGRFLILAGPVERTRIVDPEMPAVPSRVMRRAEAALRAALMINQIAMTDTEIETLATTLEREAADTSAAAGDAVADWRFFRVGPDPDLYTPVLQFARLETVFPDRFETLEELAGGRAPTGADKHAISERLYQRYLQLDADERKKRCTIYYRIRSTTGSWLIEYWMYYPFDVGGLGSHLHDPEHVFVEVDKLGGSVRRVIGAAHGFFAGNNMYSSDYAGALAAQLPLFAIVEFHKHATAADMDRDGVFTPGLDENEYRERAKIWGVRDVLGTINNQLLSFDRTMSAARHLEDALAPVSIIERYPEAKALAPLGCCQLVPMPAGDSALPTCQDATTECAKRSVMSHPDFRDYEQMLKEWVFPHSFLRASYNLGPRQRLHSVGLGYTIDLDRMPGLSRLVPLPGRVVGEVYGWRQDVTVPDVDSCLADCTRRYGIGVGVRYEQFVSNMFGLFSSVRVYSPPVSDIWITFGPMVEVPLFNRGNVGVQAGLSFRPAASPRFEMRTSVGFWKPSSAEAGLRATKRERHE